MNSSNPRRSVVSRLKRAGLSVAAIAVTRAGLRSLPLPLLSRVLGVKIGTTRGDPLPAYDWAELPPEVALPLASLDAMLRRWPGQAPCLVRALGAGWLLKSMGPTLRIGVSGAPVQKPWSAHAWLEVAGMTVPEPRHAPVRFDRLRALGRA